MNPYLVFVLVVISSKYLLGLVVNRLNIRHLDPRLPEEFKGVYNEERYARSQRYTSENSTFGLVQGTVSTAIIIPFILLGGFNYIDQVVRHLGYGPILSGLLFLGILLVLFEIIELPFSIYDTFVIEEKYGFNRTTAKTYVLDIIKAFFLSIIIGGPVFAVILWFFQETGKWAPFYVWAAVTGFQLFMMLIAPTVILPLFNKFTPLEEGELKSALENYARQNGFHIKGIFKMDESKRSSKPNAFFTGFGKSRRIVLYDTLIEKHSSDELVAILGHEIGHYKLRHMPKMVIASILETGLVFFILSLFLNNRLLFDAFKMKDLSIYASLVFFGFLYSPISLFISLVMNIFSRKQEYEADRFAVKTTGRAEVLVTAVKKLSIDTMSNLTPHPLKVFFSYSHPPVLHRIRAISKLGDS